MVRQEQREEKSGPEKPEPAGDNFEKMLALREPGKLQVAAYLSWRLATLETLLPPPLLLYLLTAFVQVICNPFDLDNDFTHVAF